MADNSKQKNKKDKKDKESLLKKIRQIYTFTVADEPKLPFMLIGAFIVPVILAVAACALLRFMWLSWILTVILGIMVGALLATIVLTRCADQVGFRKIEGRPGAAGAVLSNISKAGFTFPEEPVWIDPRTKDMVWQGSGRSGVFLIGEGDYGRVMKAMDREEEKIHRITRGSAIPIHKISIGHGPKQVPLPKLQRTVLKQKVKLTSYELTELNGRLRTLRARNASMGLPKGMDPTKMHVSRRAMRGK